MIRWCPCSLHSTLTSIQGSTSRLCDIAAVCSNFVHQSDDMLPWVPAHLLTGWVSSLPLHYRVSSPSPYWTPSFHLSLSRATIQHAKWCWPSIEYLIQCSNVGTDFRATLVLVLAIGYLIPVFNSLWFGFFFLKKYHVLTRIFSKADKSYRITNGITYGWKQLSLWNNFTTVLGNSVWWYQK